MSSILPTDLCCCGASGLYTYSRMDFRILTSISPSASIICVGLAPTLPLQASPSFCWPVVVRHTPRDAVKWQTVAKFSI